MDKQQISTRENENVKFLVRMKAWLFGTAGLTLGMISVGGLTRLTESGLSITEW